MRPATEIEVVVSDQRPPVSRILSCPLYDATSGRTNSSQQTLHALNPISLHRPAKASPRISNTLCTEGKARGRVRLQLTAQLG